MTGVKAFIREILALRAVTVFWPGSYYIVARRAHAAWCMVLSIVSMLVACDGRRRWVEWWSAAAASRGARAYSATHVPKHPRIESLLPRPQ
jgi:hypothetical protein